MIFASLIAMIAVPLSTPAFAECPVSDKKPYNDRDMTILQDINFKYVKHKSGEPSTVDVDELKEAGYKGKFVRMTVDWVALVNVVTPAMHSDDKDQKRDAITCVENTRFSDFLKGWVEWATEYHGL